MKHFLVALSCLSYPTLEVLLKFDGQKRTVSVKSHVLTAMCLYQVSVRNICMWVYCVLNRMKNAVAAGLT